MTSKTPLPGLGLGRAIEIERGHLYSNEVNLSDRSLLEVCWTQRSVDNVWCWTLTWVTLDQRLAKTSQTSRNGNGVLEVLVVDQGEVLNSFAR